MTPTVLILGPTAGGKTALAIALARLLPGGGTCISADSMQVYRGMDIGTAKPSVEERAAVPHELLDLVDPGDPCAGAEPFTVDRWLALARAAIERSRAQGRWPLVVGGTNLYVKALLDGLYSGPPADPALRAALADASLDTLREELLRVDPAAALRIHRNDRRRTVRAIEVFRATGQPHSALRAAPDTQWDRDDPGRYDAIRVVGLERSVASTNARINARVRAMMEHGLLDEVRRLRGAGQLGRQAREALGYKQLLEHLEGRCSLEDAVEAIKIASRRFAKQQRTWLRRFRVLPRSCWLDADALAPEALAARAAEALREEGREGEEGTEGRGDRG